MFSIDFFCECCHAIILIFLLSNFTLKFKKSCSNARVSPSLFEYSQWSIWHLLSASFHVAHTHAWHVDPLNFAANFLHQRSKSEVTESSSFQPSTLIFEPLILQLLLLDIEIDQNKSCRGFIQLTFSCGSLFLIRTLILFKRSSEICCLYDSKSEYLWS